MQASVPEFSRVIDLRYFPDAPQSLCANEEERTALARRFALVSIQRLDARLTLERDGQTVRANGTLDAAFVQPCAVSGEDVPVTIATKIALRFVPEAGGHAPDEELEISAEDCDEIEYTGSTIDLGEAVAQSLALEIDPYLVGPNAEEARRKAGIVSPEASGPFAALAALKKD